MTEDQTISALISVGFILLVGSSLVSRRLSFGSLVRMAISWIGIFAAAIVLFSYRGEVQAVWERVSGDLTGSTARQVTGDQLSVRMAADGHFWLSTTVNDEPVRFLVDSGATITAMSATTAEAAGVATDDTRLPVMLTTANGVVQAERGRIKQLEIGSLKVRDLPVVVSPAFGNVNVLGMNFLSQLKSWRVEGRTLILEPKSAKPDAV